MRRALVVSISVMLLTVASASAALAGKPEHSRPGVAPPVEFAAGDICDFAVTLTSTEDRGTASIWELDDGTVRILIRGYASGTAANTDDGLSITHAGGYRIEVVIHPDGSADVSGSGTLFAWYFPGDAIEGLSTGVFAVRGHGTEQYAADGSLVSAKFYGGHVVDLCDALAPAA
jgi:hypothetical protein